MSAVSPISITRAFALLIAISLTSAACTSSSPTSTPTTSATSPSAPTSPATPPVSTDAAGESSPPRSPTIDAVQAGFAAAGIDIVPDDAIVGNGKGLVFSEFQTRNLAAELDAGGGITGATLRTNLPTPDDVVPIDVIISTWLVAGTSPAAVSARSLVDVDLIIDPQGFTFPFAVISMFLNDIVLDTMTLLPSDAAAGEGPAREAHASPKATASANVAPSRPNAVQLCDAASEYFDSTIGAVSSALSSTPFLGELADWVGLGVRTPGKNEDTGTTYKAISAKGRGILATIANALAVVALIDAAATPWNVIVDADPLIIANGAFGQQGLVGSFTATLVTYVEDWPGAFKSCANFANVTLPEITPRGSPVTWELQGSDGLVTVESQEDKLNDDYPFAADLTYRTMVDPEDATGDAVPAPFTAKATVVRSSKEAIKAVIDFILDTLVASLPGVVKDLISSVVADAGSHVITLTNPENQSPLVQVMRRTPESTTTTDSSVPNADDSTTTTDPLNGCIGSQLVSNSVNYAGNIAPAGVLLMLNPDGTGVFDFGSAGQSVSTNPDPAGGVSTTVVDFGGTITFTWTKNGPSLTTTIVANNLTVNAVVTLGSGFVVNLDDLDVTGFTAGAVPEQIVCADGALTIVRTNQTFS